MKKRIFIVLGLFFLLGLALRLIYFKDATFGWDQARDAFQAINIWQGDPVKIIGPATAELPGLHHGSFYWYLISPLYFFSRGNIYVVRLFLILLNLLCIYVLYHFSFILFKNKRIALFSSFLFAVSFEAGQYGRWLSNPSPALLTILLTFLGLWQILNREKIGVPLTLISWALSVHFQFFLVYQIFFIIPVLIWTYKDRKFKLTKEDLFGFIGAFFILLPFLIAEFKFHFQGIRSFTQLTGNQELLRSWIDNFIKFFDRIVFIFYFNIFGFNLFIAGLFTVFIMAFTTFFIYKSRQYRKELIFLGLWLLSPLIIFSFERAYAYFITIGCLFPAIILYSFFIEKIAEKYKFGKTLFFIIFILLLFGQLILILNQNKTGESLFSVQKKMILSDELKVVDYVYKQSKGKNFAINTVTDPMFINTTWAYLFNYYGQTAYGYMPIWAGYPQDGQFGASTKFTSFNDLNNLDFYLIIEPKPGIPDHIIFGVSKFEDTRSTLIENKVIGGFTVQKRRLINNNNFDSDTVYKIIKKYYQ